MQADKFYYLQKYKFNKFRFSATSRLKLKANRIKKLMLYMLKKKLKYKKKSQLKLKYKKFTLNYFLCKNLQYKYGWLYTNPRFYSRKKSITQT